MTPKKKLHIAFLTPEYSFEIPYSGLGGYVNRIAKTLVKMGHKVEVFTNGDEAKYFLDSNGIVVHLLKIEKNSFLRRVNRFLSRFKLDFKTEIGFIESALLFARELKKGEIKSPFDIIQSSSYGLAGLFIPKKKNRVHMVRLSSDCLLWRKTDGLAINFELKIRSLLENRCVKKVNVAYAPSNWLAEHYLNTYKIVVKVLRPPMAFDYKNYDLNNDILDKVPDRYLVHFGVMGFRKGTDFIVDALSLIWKTEPDFKMVWAGWESRPGNLKYFMNQMGNKRENITYFEKLNKDELYTIVRNAEASVLPSRVDNLPNTAIESLTLSTPVIAFDDASLDELIETNKNGELVPFGDVNKLSNAMLKAWRRKQFGNKRQFENTQILEEMEPARAANNFIKMAGYSIT